MLGLRFGIWVEGLGLKAKLGLKEFSSCWKMLPFAIAYAAFREAV